MLLAEQDELGGPLGIVRMTRLPRLLDELHDGLTALQARHIASSASERFIADLRYPVAVAPDDGTPLLHAREATPWTAPAGSRKLEPMSKPREYEVVLVPEEEGGYSVSVPALPGLHTQGETVEEALDMAKDAIEGYLEVLKDEGRPLPEPPRIERITVGT